jgi:hypothetical protein
MRGLTMMKHGNRVTITVGTGVDKYGMAIRPIAKQQALSRLRIRFATIFGGYTETEHNGGWIYEGQLVQEASTSFQFVVDHDKLHLVGSAANWARVLLLQEQVLITREPLEYQFYDVHSAETEKAQQNEIAYQYGDI